MMITEIEETIFQCKVYFLEKRLKQHDVKQNFDLTELGLITEQICFKVKFKVKEMAIVSYC